VNYSTTDHPVSLHTRKRVRNYGADSTPSTSTSSMQHPTEDDESPDLNCDLNRKVKMRRKAAKQTLPFNITKEEIHLIQKLRLEKTLSADEGARNTASPDVSVWLPPAAAAADGDDDIDDANADPVMYTQPNTGASPRATGSWTSDEDAKLTSAVANTSKKKWGKKYKTDWVTISALVPSRTRTQCRQRWQDTLDPSIDRANGRTGTGTWTEDEDSKLKDAVLTHGSKNWKTIAALVPGRTRDQCGSRRKDILDPSINPANERRGKWTEQDEDIKLKDSVQTHGDNDWAAVAGLVPGRTRKQCYYRWKSTLDPSIDPTTARAGKWAAAEDTKLKDAVQTHGGNNWTDISALIPGRTKLQCGSRWHDTLNPSIALTARRTGTWTADEDNKLKDAVQTHGGKD
jgi:hypothetical protein